MQIEYILNAQDFMNIQKHQKALIRKFFSGRPSLWQGLVWTVVIIFWVVPTVLFVANLPSGMGYWLLYIALIPGIVLAVLAFSQRRKYYRLAASAFPPDTIRTITITDRGLDTTAGQSNSSTSWNSIREIVEVSEYVLFVLPLFQCIAVPTRSFADKDQLAGFISEAHIKMTNATALNNAIQRIANRSGSR
jgi:hypothetical protein